MVKQNGKKWTQIKNNDCQYIYVLHPKVGEIDCCKQLYQINGAKPKCAAGVVWYNEFHQQNSARYNQYTQLEVMPAFLMYALFHAPETSV